MMTRDNRHLQCSYVRWGDQAVLQVAGRRSEFDTDSDVAAQLVSKILSAYPEVIPNCGGLGRE